MADAAAGEPAAPAAGVLAREAAGGPAAPALLLAGAGAGEAALDIAVSHALLRQVARGELPSLVRVYRPLPTLAFGRLDRFPPGFPAAVAAARRHGLAPIVRLAGGRAAAYDGRSLVYEEIVADAEPLPRIRQRFRDAAELLREALAVLGADARVGELPGEYCAGEFSVNVAGRTKVVGTAQRAIRGAALTSASIVVGNGAAVRAVLIDVYAALGVAWEPATAGALEDELPGVAPADVERALLAARARRGALAPAVLGEATLALARELAGEHVLAPA
ncbi:MAG: lipoate--protein ligase family protein [Actinobacteria bacterium]|nr:lipoate--protein ligase family protein [Actinomycetota bacterium]